MYTECTILHKWCGSNWILWTLCASCIQTIIPIAHPIHNDKQRINHILKLRTASVSFQHSIFLISICICNFSINMLNFLPHSPMLICTKPINSFLIILGKCEQWDSDAYVVEQEYDKINCLQLRISLCIDKCVDCCFLYFWFFSRKQNVKICEKKVRIIHSAINQFWTISF